MGGGGKGGGGGGATGLDDTMRSRSEAASHWIISKGEIEGWLPTEDPLKSIYLDGTPIVQPDGTANFKGVFFAWRSGTPDQTAIVGTSLSGNTIAVGQKVTVATPVTRTIAGSFSAIRLSILVPSLATIDDRGNRNSAVVKFAIDISINGGAFAERIEDTIEGRTSGGYVRDYTIRVVAATAYAVRVRRITPDSTTIQTSNELYWQQHTPLLDRELSYPTIASIFLRIDSLHFRQLPKITILLSGALILRVPSNYNPSTRTYSGTWDGTWHRRVTSNPAWIAYNALTNQDWGLGNYISEVECDKWAFYDFGKYCDQLVSDGWGSTERRHTCRIKVGGAEGEDAVPAIKRLLASCGAQIHFRGGLLSISYERQNPVVVATYTTDTVIQKYDESGRVTEPAFSYTHASLETRHTVVLVTWRNPDRMGVTETETIYASDIGRADAIARYGYRPLKVDLPACTSRGEARRYARWQLLTSYREGRIVTFSVVATEQTMLAPGVFIHLHDRHRKQLQPQPQPAELYQVLTVADRGDGTYSVNAAYKDPAKWPLVDAIGLFEDDGLDAWQPPSPPTNLEIHSTPVGYVVGWQPSPSKTVTHYDLETTIAGSNVWQPIPLQPGASDTEVVVNQKHPTIFRVAAVAIDNKRSGWIYSATQFADTGVVISHNENGTFSIDKPVFLDIAHTYQIQIIWSDHRSLVYPVVFTTSVTTTTIAIDPSGIGNSATINTDVLDLAAIELSQKISYVRVIAGSLQLFDGVNHTGNSQTYTLASSRHGDGVYRADRGDFTLPNDTARSAKIIPGSSAIVSQHEPGRNPILGSIWKLIKV
jgi:hypothetical protein